MRILYDGFAYFMQPAGGINSYFQNLITRLPREFKPILTTNSRPVLQAPSHPNLRNWHYSNFNFKPRRFSSWLQEQAHSRLSKFSKYDIFHPTYYSLLSRQSMREFKNPRVLTVWDMIHERFSALDPRGDQSVLKKIAIEAADLIICISENTRTDLLELYPQVQDRTVVSYLATDITADEAMKSTPAIPPCTYFFYVGSRAAHKNFWTLADAFKQLLNHHSQVQLVVAGGSFSEEEERRLHELGISQNVQHVKHPNRDTLIGLYRYSVALIYPSLYEGFGIPPLEAMASGTAAIVARSSSIPEVVGEAGLYFDPHSSEELSSKMQVLVEDSAIRKTLITRGSKQVNLFSWDKLSDETTGFYRQVANHNHT